MALPAPLYAPSGLRVLAQALWPRVEPLPGAPLLESVLFERPWVVVVALLVGAVVVLFVFNARGRAKHGAMAAAALALVAAAIWGIAATVVTHRERLEARTRELVEATATADVAALDRILAPNARAFYSAAPRGMDREAILDWVSINLGGRGGYGIRSHRVPEVQATLDGERVGRTQVRVIVTVADRFGEGPVDSWWRVDWNLDDDGTWRPIGIRPLMVFGRADP